MYVCILICKFYCLLKIVFMICKVFHCVAINVPTFVAVICALRCEVKKKNQK